MQVTYVSQKLILTDILCLIYWWVTDITTQEQWTLDSIAGDDNKNFLMKLWQLIIFRNSYFFPNECYCYAAYGLLTICLYKAAGCLSVFSDIFSYSSCSRSREKVRLLHMGEHRSNAIWRVTYFTEMVQVWTKWTKAICHRKLQGLTFLPICVCQATYKRKTKIPNIIRSAGLCSHSPAVLSVSGDVLVREARGLRKLANWLLLLLLLLSILPVTRQTSHPIIWHATSNVSPIAFTDSVRHTNGTS